MSYVKKPSVVKIDPTVTHLQPDQFDNDDPIQGYPFGTSAMRVTTATGFPEVSGDVITSRTTDDTGSQIFIGEKAYIRTFEASAWSSWRELGESGSGGPVEWDDILNKPSQFPPSPHTHDIEDITSLQAALDDKASAQSVNELRQEVDEHKAETTQNAHLAKNIGIEDTAGNFTATNVEGALEELFTSVSNGKTLIAGAITDKGVPTSPSDTFQQMADNIRDISGGDYSVGDEITDFVLKPLPDLGMGIEIWANTDVPYGYGIAVDGAGNVYAAHVVGSGGKAVRKLDQDGNEIWSKTDVANGYGIAVDEEGNVYVAHYVGIGEKAVRKLDQDGNEIWSKTDVRNGYDIAVDSAGNVYVAHYVGTGEKAVRKLDSAGNEIWSKTDVANGYGIAVDEEGNVYVAHHVVSGKTVRKLDSAGNEIWSKTDVANGYGIAVDSVGNVYVTHSVGSGGKAVRKLDPDGNEIWAKTDVPTGRGIAVDGVGNIYVTHGRSVGEKTVRKLDSNGNEIWAKTDVANGHRIAVDGAGNAYVAHNVNSGKTVRKLDGNRYFQIVG